MNQPSVLDNTYSATQPDLTYRQLVVEFPDRPRSEIPPTRVASQLASRPMAQVLERWLASAFNGPADPAAENDVVDFLCQLLLVKTFEVPTDWLAPECDLSKAITTAMKSVPTRSVPGRKGSSAPRLVLSPGACLEDLTLKASRSKRVHETLDHIVRSCIPAYAARSTPG